MAANTTSSLCRLTVMTPHKRVDLAVPVDMTVADFLTTLVTTLGPRMADEGAAAGGFILQRAGEAPLEQSATLAASQIKDGDVLHLRMRAVQLPEVAYDDVLDAVATGVLTKSTRWAARHTAAACLAFAALSVVFVLAACLLSGPSWWAPAGIAGGLSLLLLGAGVALAWAYQQYGAALTSAALAVTSAAACGAMLVGGDNTVADFGATQLLPGGAAAVLIAVAALVLLGGRGTAGFTAVIGAGLLAAAGGAAADIGDLDPAGTAAFTAGIALLASPLMPMAAFKLSRLALPIVPTGAADLKADETTVDGTKVLGQAARADQYLTGIVIAFAVVLFSAAFLLAMEGGSARWLAAVLGGVILFRARLFTGMVQRWAMLLAGWGAGLAVWAGMAMSSDPLVRLLVVVLPVCVAALLLLALVVVLPGRRYTPPSGRAADVIEALLILSVLPLILGVIGVYGRVRGLVG